MKRQHSRVARTVKDILCVVTGREFNALNCSNNDELATIVFEDKEVENDGAIRLTLEYPSNDKIFPINEPMSVKQLDTEIKTETEWQAVKIKSEPAHVDTEAALIEHNLLIHIGLHEPSAGQTGEQLYVNCAVDDR